MDIDVVIPLYNGSKWIEETINSIICQTVKPQKIIVVDDHSTDDSLAVVEAIEGVEVFVNSKDTGQCSSARNFGFTKTSAEFVAFIDQDDLLHEKHFELLLKVLVENSDVVAAASNYVTFQNNDIPHFILNDDIPYREDMWHYFPFSEEAEPSLVLFRRSVFEQTQWNEQFPASSDHFIWLELTFDQIIYRLPAKTLGRRLHGDSFYAKLLKSPVMLRKQLLDTNNALLEKTLSKVSDQKKRNFMLCRNQILQSIIHISEGIERKDANEFFSLKIQELMALLKGEEEEFVVYSIKEMWITIVRIIKYQKDKNFFWILITIHSCWPRNEYVTLNLIENKILEMRPGMLFYRTYLLKNMLNVRAYQLLAKAVLKRIMERF